MAPTFVFDEPIEFKMKEKLFSLSEDSFSIKREDNGEQIFSVKGNSFSLRDSKTMYDKDGNALYKMTEAFLTIRSRMSIKDCESGETAFTLRKKSIIPMFGTNTIQCWKGDDDDGEPYLEVKGNFLQKDYKIIDVESEKEVAKVSRKLFTMLNLFTDKDTYSIRVEAGADAALLVFLVIAIDEQYREKEEEEEDKGDKDKE